MARDWSPLHARFQTTLRQRSLLLPQERLLVAVSGGQDSLCLLKLLLDLALDWGWQLGVIHCDHRWPSDAGIADHVAHLAAQWNLPFYLAVAETVEESEAAARHWRYQAIVQMGRAQGYGKVATGHTQSDLSETFLYNLIRGSGADGLQALGWQRALAPHLELVRPLLNVSRQETGQFCQQFHLPVWEDAANANPRYARNRLRNQLLPYLQEQFNPQVESALAQTAELLRADVEYLQASATTLAQQVIQVNRLHRDRLRAAPLALQRRVVRQFLQKSLPKAPDFAEITAVTDLLAAPNRSRSPSLPGGIVAEIQGQWLVLQPRISQEGVEEPKEINLS